MLGYPASLEQVINKESLVDLLDTLPDFVFLLAPDFTIPYYNLAFRQLFGDPKQKKCFQLIQKCDHPCSDCPSVKTRVSTGPHQWEMETLDSRTFNINERLFIGPDNIPYICKSGEEITEKNAYAHFDRLNLLAEMAASLAHEIRNPITTVKGFLQILGSKNEFSSYRDYYNIMIMELERANTLITEFLSLTKNSTQDMRIQNLNTIIETLSPLVQADTINAGITLILELGEIEDILLGEKEVRQLILNLFRNAIEATEPGKCLTLKTFMDSGQVILAIRDEGPGIRPEVLAKLGVPFFTTKEKGTGLGLAICNNIIKRHHAEMDIETSSKGTTFYIKFKTSKS
ncbi:ATP-binding protein [Desulfitobacterium sp.]|uniref:ATP-binding protein n=1 Tax=Desulfitobacterium sp. TaxID=49981 RepID=UPI002B203C23|nr:ATP-binding protein [Desulfitobacterium sp.]MEA4900688.1 ATP-binding protein [Desulfitobacterium sp.]